MLTMDDFDNSVNLSIYPDEYPDEFTPEVAILTPDNTYVNARRANIRSNPGAILSFIYPKIDKLFQEGEQVQIKFMVCH